MILLKRLPFRRLELLFSLAVVAVFWGLTGFVQLELGDQASSWLGLITLELVLPVSIGVTAAGLLAGDPALDIVLTSHWPASRVLGERMLWVGGLASLEGGIALLLGGSWELIVSRVGFDRIFIWFSPMVFYMGLSSVFSLRRGKMVDGVLATLGVMGVSLITLFQIPRFCASQEQGTSCGLWLATPLMTLGNSLDAYWPLNRLLWLGLGTALLIVSLRLTQREEQLVHEAPDE